MVCPVVSLVLPDPVHMAKGMSRDNAIKARSLTKNTRSLSDCNPSGGQTESQGGHAWDFERNNEWAMMSSAERGGYSSWTTYCYHALAVFQLIFVLMSMA
ncbi:hypothetical protein ElyMa_006775700 [Elysia marginata]|uniref:Uncharacterized protein n=1 Tax=Elysia marginata TaxID=1093978 RepID=A0AAV4J1Y4_9GAST|nr:hypothetical protein ElyMa_006775700 [Elysia marginata]